MNIIFEKRPVECINIKISDSYPKDVSLLEVDLFFRFDLSTLEETEYWLRENITTDIEELPIDQRTAGNIYKLIRELMSEHPDSHFARLIYPESL